MPQIVLNMALCLLCNPHTNLFLVRQRSCLSLAIRYAQHTHIILVSRRWLKRSENQCQAGSNKQIPNKNDRHNTGFPGTSRAETPGIGCPRDARCG